MPFPPLRQVASLASRAHLLRVGAEVHLVLTAGARRLLDWMLQFLLFRLLKEKEMILQNLYIYSSI